MPGSVVIDPFVGSNVTGTAARAVGLRFVGVEAHPLVAELARIKVRLPASAWRSGRAAATGSAAALGLVVAGERLLDSARRTADSLRASDIAREAELVRGSFDAETLRTLIAARNAVDRYAHEPWATWAKWALLGTLREVSQVQVGWPYQRPGVPRRPRYRDVNGRIEQRISLMADDIWGVVTKGRQTAGSQLSSSRVLCADARLHSTWRHVAPASVDYCISSPPYLNNFDYADATRLELYFLRICNSWQQMSERVRSNMMIATTQQARKPIADDATRYLRTKGAVGQEIQTLTRALAQRRLLRVRGKEYDRVVPAYFHDISKVLANLATVMRPGGKCAWLVGDSAPYGIYIDTPRLIGALAETAGFEIISDTVLRSRGQRWSGNSSRHQVALTERLLVFRRRADLCGGVANWV